MTIIETLTQQVRKSAAAYLYGHEVQAATGKFEMSFADEEQAQAFADVMGIEVYEVRVDGRVTRKPVAVCCPC